ncbi:hypothetical protein C2G38_2148356 [Gigaspora rosea]|uniref:RING-type domain-containing protein n=1 Tax=Gigaspora rosea TaxID=44941 RepID=A0A397U6D1_9GLOM|nr:hypothetical protein C2G38_2148356 [Gigaspora rosea]
MFVRILQILALLALINTSTTYVIHINNTTNSNIPERDHTYSIHTVHWKSRGYTNDVDNVKIHFLDYQQQSKWTYTSEHLADQVNSAGTVCGDASVLWWDGWESIALLLLSLGHRLAPHLFSEPPRAEPCLACKQKIIDPHAMFRCGRSFHIKCCRATSVRSEQCLECRDHINERLGFNNMSGKERLLVFIREVSTEVMAIDNNSSEVLPQDQLTVLLRKLSRKIAKLIPCHLLLL